MKVYARVTPNSRRESVRPGDIWEVRVNAPAREGKATERARTLIADRLGVPPSRVRLLKGAASRSKTFHIS